MAGCGFIVSRLKKHLRKCKSANFRYVADFTIKGKNPRDVKYIENLVTDLTKSLILNLGMMLEPGGLAKASRRNKELKICKKSDFPQCV